MPRITSDPSLEVPPDFASDAFQPIRAALVATNQQTEEEATASLLASWTNANNARKELWAVQVEDDRLLQEAEEEQLRRQREEEEAAARADALKKHPKLPDFNEDAGVPDTIARCPSPYALNKIAALEYVELWYFTPEGCDITSETTRSSVDEIFGITKVEDTIALRSVSSAVASRHVVQDQDLSFRQMCLARLSLVQHMIASGSWSERYISAIVDFFVTIESSPVRTSEEILLLYQAQVRRFWHDRLKLNDPFNIGKFNQTLLTELTETFWDGVRANLMKRVSPFLLSNP
jgi:hypothetical protein